MQEMFIQYLAEQGHNVVRSERKPRPNIQYRDLCKPPYRSISLSPIPCIQPSNIPTANAVSHLDNLEFLVDVVPKTIPFKEVKEKKSAAGAGKTNGESSIEAGQSTLDGKKPMLNGTNGFGGHAAEPVVVDDEEGGDPNAQLEMEI